MDNIFPVILAGGSGSRLWPLSRSHYPKQFLELAEKHSLLQETVLRVKALGLRDPAIICNEAHRFLVADQCRDVGVTIDALIVEPVGRNTAPAASVACLHALEKDDEPLIWLMPADHHISNPENLQTPLERATEVATSGGICTFGILPSHAETGFGYVEAGECHTVAGVHQIRQFTEKPDAETAHSFVQSGRHYWNSGMFLFRGDVFLREIEKFNPEIYSASRQAYQQREVTRDFVFLDEERFSSCPSDSIDYAVMEHTDNGAVVPLDIGWNDIGSWQGVWEIGEKDASSNVMHGDVMLVDTENSLIHADSRLVTTIGVKDVAIVETDDAVLVAAKDRVQDVRMIVNNLHAHNREEHLFHNVVHRPWGSYETINQGNRYQVKRIMVKPGASISLQKHHHRAEHWIVVSGTAEIQKGDEQLLLTENQSTFIPLGVKHRLTNPGKVVLEMIEVQSGTYLGEDDIVRFEDYYGRN